VGAAAMEMPVNLISKKNAEDSDGSIPGF